MGRIGADWCLDSDRGGHSNDLSFGMSVAESMVMTSRLGAWLAAASIVMIGDSLASSPTSSQAAFAPASSVVGTVVDAAGQHLPGVAVTAIPETGGEVRAAMSGSNGSYTFDDLPDGTYRIDWYLPGFDVMRRNHVQVLRGETAQVDVALPVSTICECIDNWGRLGISRPRLTTHVGRVMDESGRPLPHARVEIVSPVGREAAYADREGRFQVLLSSTHTWPLTARDSGFGAVTLRVSGGTRAPTLVFRLPNVDTRTLPVVERLTRPCCPDSDLLTDPGR
jgi:hypothetical protein